MPEAKLRELTTRERLNRTLDHILHLQHGLALCCSPVNEDQMPELLKAKEQILALISAEDRE